MEIRTATNPRDFKSYDSQRIAEEFLIDGLFQPDICRLVYSHIDRIIVGGIMPVAGPVALAAADALRADYFLERRELGVINIGGPGRIVVDGTEYVLAPREALYAGRGSREVSFASLDPAAPAKFYLNSAPAHRVYPTEKIGAGRARKVVLGSAAEANRRTINQYLHPDVLPTCQLVMGLTALETGSVWNTMPCHTHDRRMEVYLYLDIPENAVVFHFMGEPGETRHIVVRNEQAVISPSWSIHSGVGTASYSFIWGMVGENQTFTDMDNVPMASLR